MKTARKLALGGAEIRLQPRYNAFSGLDYPNHSTLRTHYIKWRMAEWRIILHYLLKFHLLAKKSKKEAGNLATILHSQFFNSQFYPRRYI